MFYSFCPVLRGNIYTGAIEAYAFVGSTGNGGNITLSSEGEINTTAGRLNSSGNHGGGITLTAKSNIYTGTVDTYAFVGSTGNGSNITLSSSEGEINTTAGRLNSSGNHGGDITLTAKSNIYTGTVEAYAFVGSTGKGGNITLSSEGDGDINTTAGRLSSSGNHGGDITLTTKSNIYTGTTDTYASGGSTGNGGYISLTSTTGNIDTTKGTLNSTSDTNKGGAITFSSLGNISTGGILSHVGAHSSNSGGDISLTSETGSIDTTKGELNSSSYDLSSGNRGAIYLSANNNITTGKLISNSGTVKLTSNQGAVATQDITSGSDTTITADQIITTGSILSNNGAVKLTSKLSAISTQDITTGGNAAANSAENKVDVTLQAADGITTANLSTHSLGKVSVSSGKVDDKIYNSSGNVTFGSITAKEVDILSNGGVSAQSDIETKDGDVDITALQDIVAQKITATDGAVRLISGLGAITVTGEINSDNGLTALARQNITTDKIHSDKYAVLLNSSQGAITVNGAIASYGDVSLAALEDVVAQNITSLDGAVALISSNGTVTAQGAIASIEDVSLGAVGDVIARNITSTYGDVALVSSQGTVSASEISSEFSIAISAKQNITTADIFSQWGAVALISEQGTVTTAGNITTNVVGGDVYISSVGNVVIQNIITKGGVISIASSQGSVTTGYLRSDDGNGSGGKVYFKTSGLIKVTGSVSVDNTLYGIYTGVDKKKWIEVVYQSGTRKANKSKFSTAAHVLPEVKFTQLLPGEKDDLLPGLGALRFLIETIWKRIYERGNPGNTENPGHIANTNPITGNLCRNDQERELVKQLNPEQEQRLSDWINSKTRVVTLDEEEVFKKGKVDTHSGCFTLELSKHYGDWWDPREQDINITHSLYATYVTGAYGDYFVLPRQGKPALFDGLVKKRGEVVFLGLENPDVSVGEVKTGDAYGWALRKNLPPGNPNRVNSQMNLIEQRTYRGMREQIPNEVRVAEECGFEYFLSFSNQRAYEAALIIFGDQTSSIHYINILGNLQRIIDRRQVL